jgi:Protein of unknown function (DUF3618)
MTSALPDKTDGHQDAVVGKVVQGPAGGDDAQRLREEIERTREHLGATVEQLLARADIKSRAQAEAAELTGRLKAAAAQARQAAPGYARRAIEQGKKTARDQQVPLSVAAVILVAASVSLFIWQRRRR